MDEKDLELQKTDTDSVADNTELQEKAAQKFSGEKTYKKTELDEELERLAQTFRDELKKAQETEGEEYFEEVVPAEDLCECCGENPKDTSFGKDYQYCAQCRDAMKRYPVSWYNVVIAIVTLILSVVSVATFLGDFDGYYAAYKAKAAVSERKMTTAISFYEEAIGFFDEEDINAKGLRLDCADAIYETMPYGVSSMDKISDLISDAITDFESRLPIYKTYVDMRDEVMVLYGTMQKFYVVVNNAEYSDYTDDKVYEKAMTAIGQILDEQIEVKSIDGQTKNKYPADEAVVRFCQFMYAYTAGKHEESYRYMRQVYAVKPEYLWLYAYELGLVESQTGEVKEAKRLAEAMYNNNIEDYSPYCVYASAERLSGNFDKAIEWTDKGIKNVPGSSEILRHKGMTLAAKGEYEQAKAVLEDANKIEENGLLSITLLVIENELGNADSVKEITDYLEEQGVEIPERAKSCLEGKITIKELFAEGTGDIE